MDLSIITVTWNNSEVIARQIKSVVLASKNISFEQFVVDNGSKDNTVEIVSSEFPQVKLIKNTENKGFGYSNNQAASLAQGDFLLFLNPDMELTAGSLNIMVNWMRQHPKVGLASCKLVTEDGKINEEATPRRFPRAWEMAALILKLPHLFPRMLNKYLMKGFNPDLEQEVDSVRGAFMLMWREVYEKLGWAFDPRYFIWFEDVDTCREVKKMGYQVIYTPIISCIDYVGQSFKKRTTLWKQKQFTKSMVLYFRKWGKWYEWLPIIILRPIGIFLAWLSERFKSE